LLNKFKTSSRSFDESSKTKRFWDALGPFPRSTWIHPHTHQRTIWTEPAVEC